MKELIPYVNKENDQLVFVERIKDGIATCVTAYLDHIDRENHPIESLRPVLNEGNASRVDLRNLDLYFKVLSITSSINTIGSQNNYDPILHSVLKLRSMEMCEKTVIYTLQSGGKNYGFIKEDIKYLPFIEEHPVDYSSFKPSFIVVAKERYPCHNIEKGDIFTIINLQDDSTIYLLNKKNGERIVSYPYLFKLYSE